MSTSGNCTTLTCNDIMRSHDAVCINARKILRNLSHIQNGVLATCGTSGTLNSLVTNPLFTKTFYVMLFVATVLIIVLNRFLRMCTEIWKTGTSPLTESEEGDHNV